MKRIEMTQSVKGMKKELNLLGESENIMMLYSVRKIVSIDPLNFMLKSTAIVFEIEPCDKVGSNGVNFSQMKILAKK